MPDTRTSTAPSEAGRELHLGWALVLISTAQLMVVLDSTIANIALPYIGTDLGIGAANLQWIVTGYALAFGGLLLLGGRLGDLYGRRRVFVAGLVVFAVASLLGGLAQTEALLLASRALQGLGAALASPAALALITTMFPAGPQRNRAFAMYAAMSGIGAAVGLILGGWLTGTDGFLGLELSGWRLTFLINVPIGLVAALLAPRHLVESSRRTGRLDVPGALTGTLGLLGIVYGLSRAGDARFGWTDPWTLASLAAGVLTLLVFLVVESRVEHPLLPFRIFRSRTRASSFAAMMIMPAAMFAMFFFLSLLIQNVMGYSPLETGFAFLPFSVAIIVSATVSSRLVSLVDPRVVAGTGTLLSAVALFGFSRISVDDSPAALLRTAADPNAVLGSDVSYATDVLPFVVLMALGMGATFVPLTLTALHHVRSEDSGIGSGVLNTMQQVGGALGLATLSTVALHASDDRAAAVAERLAQAGGGDPAAGASSPEQAERLGALIGQAAFTEGATDAFAVGAVMILVASVIIWTLLGVKHEELATDGPEGVHVGA